MESKLPKPSGLKRPGGIPKAILPTDRIKSNLLSGFGSKTSSKVPPSLSLDEYSTSSYTGLSRGLGNISENFANRKRGDSPDVAPLSTQQKAKLRRSRSACDLRDSRPLKRFESNNYNKESTIPTKAARFGNYHAVASTSSSSLKISEKANTTFSSKADSPETKAVTTHQRAKMRRSRSVCDLRETRPLKRFDSFSKQGTIPGKAARFGSSGNVTATSSLTSLKINEKGNGVTSSKVSLKRLGTNTQKPIQNKSVNNITKKPLGNSNNASSVSGAAKTAGAKRIPPYDYKARFNDLLEKHKTLKEKYDEKCDQFGNLENLPEQLEETQADLIKTKEQLQFIQSEKEYLQRLEKSLSSKVDTLTTELASVKAEYASLQEAHDKIKTEHELLLKETSEMRIQNAALLEENSGLKEDLSMSKEQVFLFNMERKELHNKIMDLRGNIRVFCRIRPPLDVEQDKPLCGWNYIDESSVEIQGINTATNKQSCHTFSFDQVFHPNTSQEEIFEMVSPLIQSAMDGYNVCIFAYGQTGSGKTYTMDGIPTNVGVIPRTVDLLFDSIKNYKRLGWDYEIKVTFLEIYNEVLFDLLSNEQKDLEIRMSKQNKNEIYVSNITEETVKSANHLRQLMEWAKANRATASTVGNERSSRSHAVTKIQLTGVHSEKNEISFGTINLVDLAGSESPKTSTRMAETKNINRSLSELTNVILALLQKQDHIPYRNSKLTHLLMPSLGGNSKTLMFINVAPLQDCFVESVKSLRFAASVNSCKMSKAKRNRVLNSSLLKND